MSKRERRQSIEIERVRSDARERDDKAHEVRPKKCENWQATDLALGSFTVKAQHV